MDASAWLPLIFLVLVFAALFAGFPVVFTLAGGSLAFAALASLLGAFDTRLLYALPSRIYGLLADDTLVSIPLFVLMGTLLDRTKIAQGLLETMGLAFRRIPGGLGIPSLWWGPCSAPAQA